MAGVGNVLCGDDGVGVAVAQLLSATPVPGGVRVLETGTGGIHLVQQLLDGAAGLVVVDAVDAGRPPGAVLVMRPAVRDLSGMPPLELREQLADTHLATPARMLAVARALGVLPGATWMVGVQKEDGERLEMGLSPPVHAAVTVAAAEVRRVVSDLGVAWPDH